MKKILLLSIGLFALISCADDDVREVIKEKEVPVEVEKIIKDTVYIRDTISVTIHDTIIKNIIKTDTINNLVFSYPHLQGSAKKFMEESPYSLDRMAKEVWNKHCLTKPDRMMVSACWYNMWDTRNNKFQNYPSIYMLIFESRRPNGARSIYYDFKGYMIFDPYSESAVYERMLDPRVTYSGGNFFTESFVANAQILRSYNHKTASNLRF
ncbi:hypothetical protein ACT4R9_09630 [Ornithobacterium rhinotracheale]|uniref:hypothetical protein n=1 Tax=Ornithobacterium rhinotracheale TaxID=28251 RepID=UPI003FA44761